MSQYSALKPREEPYAEEVKPRLFVIGLLIVLMLVITSLSTYIAAKRHGGCPGNPCVKKSTNRWIGSSVVLIVFMLSIVATLLYKPGLFGEQYKYWILGLLISLSVIASLGWGLYAGTYGDENCQCVKRGIIIWSGVASGILLSSIILVLLLLFGDTLLLKYRF